MGENPIKVTGIQKQPKQFRTTGIKLSTLKEQNELLYNYFKTNGYKEDAIIYSSDVDTQVCACRDHLVDCLKKHNGKILNVIHRFP